MALRILQTGGRVVPRQAWPYRKPLNRLGRTDLKLLANESLKGWIRHKCSRLGASLAFYTLLSLAPLLLIAVFIGGFVFGDQTIQGQIVGQITGLIGPQGASGVRTLLAGAHNTMHGILASAIGLVTLLFGASAVVLMP